MSRRYGDFRTLADEVRVPSLLLTVPSNSDLAAQSAPCRSHTTATTQRPHLRERYPLCPTLRLRITSFALWPIREHQWIKPWARLCAHKPQSQLRSANQFTAAPAYAWDVPAGSSERKPERRFVSELPQLSNICYEPVVAGLQQSWHRGAPSFALGARKEQAHSPIVPAHSFIIVRIRVFSRPQVIPSIRANSFEVRSMR